MGYPEGCWGRGRLRRGGGFEKKRGGIWVGRKNGGPGEKWGKANRKGKGVRRRGGKGRENREG